MHSRAGGLYLSRGGNMTGNSFALRFGRIFLAASMACALAEGLAACAYEQGVRADAAQAEQCLGNADGSFRPMTQELANLIKSDANLKRMLEKSIAAAAAINPDPLTNPAQTLEQYLEYINWAETAMPWAILPNVEKNHPKLYEQIDQSLNYFYFVNDRPLEELKGKGLYIPSLQYAEPYRSWMIRFVKQYGSYLSEPQSWSAEHLEAARSDERFRLDSGDYEHPSNWKSFNDFFVRRLADPSKRPISDVNDDAVVVSPADAVPQGVWRIDEKSMLTAAGSQRVGQPDFVAIKSKKFSSAAELLGPSRYRDAFAGGTMTHTFLDVFDYHRFHFPISGTIREVMNIPGDAAVGGYISWDPVLKKYLLNAGTPGWQTIESRALVIVETEQFGLVAVLPIGMSQISSVALEKDLKPGKQIKKGDEFGAFLFGGSDIVLLFQKGVKFELSTAQKDGSYPHLLMGQKYGTLSKKR